jgi:hypothetical protein
MSRSEENPAKRLKTETPEEKKIRELHQQLAEAHAKIEALEKSTSGHSPSGGASGEGTKASDSETSGSPHVERAAGGRLPGEIALTASQVEGVVNKIIGRPSTNLGSKQGDHTIAFVLLKESILQSVDGRPIAEAAENLTQIFNIFSPEKSEKERLQILLQEHQKKLEENNLNFSREDRKKLTQLLRRQNLVAGRFVGTAEEKEGKIKALELPPEASVRLTHLLDVSETFEEKDISKIRDLLKFGYCAISAKLITELEEFILETASKAEDVAFPRSRNESGIHDRAEAKAMTNLRLFSKLHELTKNYYASGVDSEKPEMLENFKTEALEIMRLATPTLSKPETINAKFSEFLKDFFGEDATQNLSEIDGGFVTKIREFLTQKEESSKASGGYGTASPPWCRKLGENINELFDFGYVKSQDSTTRGTEAETLSKLTAKLAKIAFRTFDFPNWSHQLIADELVTEILNNPADELAATEVGRKGQGWGKLKLGRGEEPLGTILKSKILEETPHIASTKSWTGRVDEGAAAGDRGGGGSGRG